MILNTHTPTIKWLYSHTDYYKDGRITNFAGPSEYLPNRFQRFAFKADVTNEPLSEHKHNNPELIYVKSGKISTRINDVEYTANAGQLIVIPPNTWHYNPCFFSGTDEIMIILDSNFTTDKGINISNYNFRPIINSADLGFIPDRIYEEIVNSPLYYWQNIQHLTTELIIELVRNFSELKKTSEMPDNPKITLVKTIASFIQTEYKNPITLDDIAWHTGLNREYISRTFRQVTGRSLWFHLNYIRCEKAEQLLRTTNFPLDIVAKKCGFRSVKYLKQVYQNYRGKLPEEQ